MIPRPSRLQMFYIRAVGACAVGIAGRTGDERANHRIFLSSDPWGHKAAKKAGEILHLFWYSDPRHAERALDHYRPDYDLGLDPAEIASTIFRRGGPRCFPHEAFIHAAQSTVQVCELSVKGHAKVLNEAYRTYRLAEWAANRTALTYAAFIEKKIEKVMAKELSK